MHRDILVRSFRKAWRINYAALSGGRSKPGNREWASITNHSIELRHHTAFHPLNLWSTRYYQVQPHPAAINKYPSVAGAAPSEEKLSIAASDCYQLKAQCGTYKNYIVYGSLQHLSKSATMLVRTHQAIHPSFESISSTHQPTTLGS